MKAQASLELMLVFGASIALVAFLSLGIARQAQDATERAEDAGEILRAEAAARAAEAALRGGVSMDLGIRHSIENGRFHSVSGRLIETAGVFHASEDEPV